MKKALFWLVALVLCLVLLVAVCLALMIQTTPSIPLAPPKATEELILGTELLRRTKRMLTDTGQSQRYAANVEELNSVFGLANKRFHQIQGRASISENTLYLDASVRIPKANDLYINASSSVREGESLIWTDSRIGNLPIPDAFANWAFRFLGTKFLQSNFEALVDEGIQLIFISGQEIAADVILPEDLPGKMQGTLGMLGGISQDEQVALLKSSAFYLERLERAYNDPSLESMEFSTYLNVLGENVLLRLRDNDTEFVSELEAAIFSLAFVMEPGIMSPFLPGLRSDFRLPNVTLDKRSDFSKHFILSAVLEILSNKEVAFAIGEIKEIRDSQGGSGYSLKDIAADRAGIYFVRQLLTQEVVAQRFVNPRYPLSDYHYFPSVLGLEEGLAEAEFKASYGSTQSRRYLELIADIDRRLSRLPLYR